MRNRLGLTVDDIQLRSLDQDGTGGTVFYDPAYAPTAEPIADETTIVYPKVIDTIAEQQQPLPDYLPEECIDCESQQLVPNPYSTIETILEPATTEPTPQTTTNKISDWIKANKGVVLVGGAGLFLLLADKKKKKVGATKKNNRRLLLAGAAAVGVYFLIKRNQQSQIPTEPVIDTSIIDTPVIDPGITEPTELPVITPTDPYAYSELDRSYYDQMWRLLSNNYLYQEHPYDYPWAGEVLKEYKYIIDGHPTSSQWNVGVPGAFMVMLDRWYRYYLTDSKKKLFEPTLFQIGNLYKAYLNQISTL